MGRGNKMVKFLLAATLVLLVHSLNPIVASEQGAVADTAKEEDGVDRFLFEAGLLDTADIDAEKEVEKRSLDDAGVPMRYKRKCKRSGSFCSTRSRCCPGYRCKKLCGGFSGGCSYSGRCRRSYG